MTYKDARKLHNGDEVIHKKTGSSLYVVSTMAPDAPLPHPTVFVSCDDGNTYHHRSIK